MTKEDVRKSFNTFIKMYYDAAREIYEEMNFDQIPGRKFKYLRKIHEVKSISPSELAKEFNLSKPTITEIINRLLESGLIVKEQDDSDRRKYYVSLTEKGLKLAKSNEYESKRAVEKIYQILDDEEIDVLVKLFDKFEVMK